MKKLSFMSLPMDIYGYGSSRDARRSLCYRQTVALGAAVGRKRKPSWNCMGEEASRTLLGVKIGKLWRFVGAQHACI